jgi:hypothetical protein
MQIQSARSRQHETEPDDLRSAINKFERDREPRVIGDLKLLAPSTNYPPVTKCDGPIPLHLGTLAHSPEENWTAQHVEFDFAAQLTSDHEFGFVNRDQFSLTLRYLGSPRSVVT